MNDSEFAAVLHLNNAHESELSRLDMPELRRLLAAAYFVKALPEGAAFLMAFAQDSAYDGFNFRWFRERYDRFVYVDRVVVAPAARGRGLARALYDDLFASARADAHELICCEVNTVPPNPASDAFHAALGFRAIGRGDTPTGKSVAYYTKTLGYAAPVQSAAAAV